MTTALRAATPADASAIAQWRYPSPFDVYDVVEVDGIDPPDAAGHGYYVLDDEQGVVAFVCLGPEGRVPGQQPEPHTLDVGMGVRPDAVSSGVATALLPQVHALASGLAARRLRTAVASFNERSLRLCSQAGFVERRRFTGPSGREFVELVRDV